MPLILTPNVGTYTQTIENGRKESAGLDRQADGVFKLDAKGVGGLVLETNRHGVGSD